MKLLTCVGLWIFCSVRNIQSLLIVSEEVPCNELVCIALYFLSTFVDFIVNYLQAFSYDFWPTVLCKGRADVTACSLTSDVVVVVVVCDDLYCGKTVHRS